MVYNPIVLFNGYNAECKGDWANFIGICRFPTMVVPQKLDSL